MRNLFLFMGSICVGLTLAAAASAAAAQDIALTPYEIAAGDNPLAQRATPSREVVGDIYYWVHTSDYADIEKRLRGEITNTTRRIYNIKDGAGVKYMAASDVYYWNASSGQIKRGTWAIQETDFGPQICETFYGEKTCLNTVGQLSGVGIIDSRKGDVFGLARGGRPVMGNEGLPDWVG